MVRVAVNVPTLSGWNVKLKVQDEFAGTLVPQVLVSLKGPFEPVHEMLVMGSAVGPTFWKATVIGPLVVPTAVFGKVIDVGVMSTAVALPLTSSPSSVSVKLPL